MTLALLLYVPQEIQCTKDMLPWTEESAFPEEARLPTADGFATPEDFAGDFDAFLGGIHTTSFKLLISQLPFTWEHSICLALMQHRASAAASSPHYYRMHGTATNGEIDNALTKH
jgi:hypothetical protein